MPDFASQLPATYCYVTRSVRLNGFICTSIKLEAKFWSILEEIARKQGMALSMFLNPPRRGRAIHGEVKNFASLLRCTCLIYLTDVRGAPRPSRRRRSRAAVSAFG